MCWVQAVTRIVKPSIQRKVLIPICYVLHHSPPRIVLILLLMRVRIAGPVSRMGDTENDKIKADSVLLVVR